jgi:hemerythrin
MEIKVPPLKEFADCLKAAEYTYLDMHKNVNVNLPAKSKDIRQFMGIDEEEQQRLLEIFDEWCAFMAKNGANVNDYMHCNRQNTKKRIALASKGEKWGNRKY